MIFGLEHVGVLYDLAVREYVAALGVPMLMVDYRVAPEHPFPGPSRTATRALRWLPSTPKSSASTPPHRCEGESAGWRAGGGRGLMARDRGGPAVAQQVLIYPMLDDRAGRRPQAQPFPTGPRRQRHGWERPARR